MTMALRRIGALALVIGAVWGTSRIMGEAAGHRGSAFALGFALLAATLAGWIAEKVRLPKISGYLLLGVLAGPDVGRFITSEMASDLKLINGIAVSLLAFVAGLEIHAKELKHSAKPLAVLCATVLPLVFVGVAAVCYAASPILPATAGLGWGKAWALCLVFGAIMMTYSPAVTIAVLSETRSKGPLSELVMAMAVVGDLVVIVIFAITMTVARGVLGGGGAEGGAALRLVWEIFGSLGIGVGVGAGVALYLKYLKLELSIVLVALFAVLAQVCPVFHLDSLLVALAAGMFVRNVMPPAGKELEEACEKSLLPVLVLFFTSAGASLHLHDLATLWPFALAIALARVGLTRTGVRLGARWTESLRGPREYTWYGLISQAGVTLGLASIVAREFPGPGEKLAALALAIIAIHELAGPVLFKYALGKTGETGAADRPAAAQSTVADTDPAPTEPLPAA